MPDIGAPYQHRGTRAIQTMVEYAPSTGGLALWTNHQDVPSDIAAPPVRTDGTTVFYGQVFEALPLAQQVGLVAHEVLHIALRHAQRFLDLQRLLGDVDLELFTICADAIVNTALGHLSWLQLPAKSVFLDQLLAEALGVRQGPEAALLQWDVEQLYRVLDDRRSPDPEGGRNGARGTRDGAANSGAETEGHARPRQQGAQNRSQTRQDGQRAAKARACGTGALADLTPRETAGHPPEAEADAARAWSERLLRGHAGDGAFSMLRTLMADLPRSRIPWEQVLRTQLARSLAPKPSVSWSRPTRSYIANQGRGGANRRLPWEPGFSAAKLVPRLAIIVDVSGSIEGTLMERFGREIEAISRRLDSSLVLVIGDDKVRRVETFPPGRADLGGIEFHGGGGTNFTPLLEEAAKCHPDIAVVLTDLEGPALYRPSFPVLWAVPPSHGHAVPPFGRKLTLDH